MQNFTLISNLISIFMIYAMFDLFFYICLSFVCQTAFVEMIHFYDLCNETVNEKTKKRQRNRKLWNDSPGDLVYDPSWILSFNYCRLPGDSGLEVVPPRLGQWMPGTFGTPQGWFFTDFLKPDALGLHSMLFHHLSNALNSPKMKK